MNKRKLDGKRTRARLAKAPEQAHCSRCRQWMPVGHVCLTRNAADAKAGRRPVFAVRMPQQVRDRLEALVAKRSESQRWPRVTAGNLVVQAVVELLQREGL